ncbi:MAG TPA: protein kinase [Thermoanaerobaculia bacterium]|nr:protein kinase [Thermoanaerobaculia bacterium]
MTLASGVKLGGYQIVSPLGAGGMGEVYRAADTKLGREVAVKVLPERLAEDAEALARFEREARAVAALNHPNILGIYDFGREGGVAYAVMELLEGETLRDRLEAGAIPVRKAIDYAHQMAIGLAAAHERGIIHRDLKPENVFLTGEGRVKILDFGLAKRTSTSGADEVTSAPTLSQQTDPGTVMGTVGYMSPEQVRGLAVDARSDVFAFGAILYEMLSGRRAFRRDTASDTMSAILRDEPPELLESGRNIPPALDRIVRHCLEKNPAERFHSARDIAFDLEAVGTASTSGTARPETLPGRRIRMTPALAVAVMAAALAAGALLDRVLRRPPEPALVAIRPLTHSGKDMLPAVSPDGKTIAFTSFRDGTPRIWLKQIATGDEVALTSGSDFDPRFSPDGAQVLFLHGELPLAIPVTSTDADLYRIPVIGGTPRKIAVRTGDADWSPDGKAIAFVRVNGVPASSTLSVVGSDGGEPKEIYRVSDRLLRWPRYSPDGKTIAVSSYPALAGGSRIDFVASDGASHRTLPVPPSLGLISSVVWGASSRDLHFAQALQARYGGSRLVREDVRSGAAKPLVWLPFEVESLDSLADGVLVADGATARQNLAEIDLADPAKPPKWLTRGTSADRQPVFSPDGEWVAFSSNRSGNLDIWEVSTKTGAIRRLTEDASDDWDPGFTHDGRLIWSSARTGHLEIWQADADGSSPRAVTRQTADAENPTDTGDGWIYYALTSSSHDGLWKTKADGSGEARVGPCVNVPEVSPDGRWIACPDLNVGPIRVIRTSDGAVVPFTVDVPHPRTTDTQMGRARWSIDGRRLYFLGQDDNGVNGIYAQDFDPEKSDTRASRRKVAGFDPNLEAESFAISPDGKRLVVAFLERLYGISTIEGVPAAARRSASR